MTVSAATLDAPMAKKKQPDSAAPISVKLPADVVVSARTISGIDNLSVADVIAIAAREGRNLRTWEKEALARRTKQLEGK